MSEGKRRKKLMKKLYRALQAVALKKSDKRSLREIRRFSGR